MNELRRGQIWTVLLPNERERSGIVISYIEQIDAALMVPLVSGAGKFRVPLREHEVKRPPAFASCDVVTLLPSQRFLREHGELTIGTMEEIDGMIVRFLNGKAS